MGRMAKISAAMMLMVALSAGAASAAVKHGTNAGETLRGTAYADTLYGYGGADLLYGYGGKDVLYGGNEVGWGDKILGANGSDRLLGQKGDDALYGEKGDDRAYGGYGEDLMVGGDGEDVLDGGPGADEVNAQDGQKDTVVIGTGEGDVVYYDRSLDVLEFVSVSVQGTEGESTASSAAEAGKKAELHTERPPASLFEHTGKVLVKHEGEELLVAEKELEVHLGHGDEILDPTGRSSGAERVGR